MISDVSSVRVGHLDTLSQCALKLSQGAPSLSQGAPKVSQGTYFTATFNISQLQVLATGICSVEILILVRSTLFLGT